MAELAVSSEQAVEPATRLIRVGTWYLVPPKGTDEDNPKVVAAIVKALEADARVLDVSPPDLHGYWTSRHRRWPDFKRTDPGSLITGSDSFSSLQLSSPILFDLRVPVKNQPTHHGARDIPTDRYSVAWDGCAIFVVWDQADEHVPLSGGHIAMKVLSDVLAAANCDLYVESCSPECDFMFMHKTLHYAYDDQIEDDELRPSGGGKVELVMAIAGSPQDIAEFAWHALSGRVQNFADFKNVGRRLVDIEDRCREDLAHLLGHHYAHAKLVAGSRSIKNLRERWAGRRWRAEARALISGLWLCMANLESLRRMWEDHRHYVEIEPDSMFLFGDDFARDTEAVTKLKTEPIAETVDQVASGLDNRLVVVATAWGALAGGVAGGAVGLLTS